MDHVRQVVELIGAGLQAGPARSALGLSLIPLFGGSPASEYMLASQAFAAGLLTVSELGGGSVPEVLAANGADMPVLLIDGEHIEGAKQNRILNVTVLIAAHDKIVLPVACVEQGRWHYEDASHFAPSHDIAYSRLRSKNAAAVAMSARLGGGRAVDQEDVWAEVAAKHAEMGVEESPTGAMRHAYEQRRIELDDILARMGEPQPGQTGVVACVGGRPVALDAFDRPETLAKMWDCLLSGYAMDALGAPADAVSKDAVRRFLRSAAGGHASSHAGVGLGTEVVLTSEPVVGHALAWEQGIVHLALFSRAEHVDPDPYRQGPIVSPNRRRGLRRTGD